MTPVMVGSSPGSGLEGYLYKLRELVSNNRAKINMFKLNKIQTEDKQGQNDNTKG